ncbi:MAG: TonB-dependent receptor, partial [Thiobacillus sp.]|nr:TonB-dependent receptor [Thiobacillus sp.]
GARLEHNDYTGFVFQPNLRLLWNPEPNTSAWVSVARAVRTPSRMERGGATLVRADSSGVSCGTAPLPCALELFSRALDDETVDALDLGWRKQLTPAASLDLAAFYYRYEQLRGAAVADSQFVVVAPGPVGYVLIETEDNNANSADVYGLEASLDWRASTDWRLQAQYSWLQNRVHTAGLPGQAESDYTGVSPSQMLSLRSSLNLTPSLRWDAWLRHTSRIRTSYFSIPAYTTLDMRLAWQAGKDIEVALVGQNLLDSAHQEFGGIFLQSTPSEIERGFYASLNWKF